MKEHPIIFNGEMVRALLDGRKTQTRRIITQRNSLFDGHPGRWPDGEYDWDSAWVDDGPSPAGNAGPYLKLPRNVEVFNFGRPVHRIYPRIQPGDVIWVRETWADIPETSPGNLHYRASGNAADDEWFKEEGWRWRPSIHMFRWASRITREVESVRIERVQDISPSDCECEGIEGYSHVSPVRGQPYEIYKTNGLEFSTPVSAFKSLWDGINGKRDHAFEKNSWVYVYDFKVVQDEQ